MSNENKTNPPNTPRNIGSDSDIDERSPRLTNEMISRIVNERSPSPFGFRIPVRTDTIARENANHARTNIYNICGEELDRRFFQSIIRLLIALFVLTYSAIQLSSDCNKNNEVYLVLISSILGFYMNSVAGFDQIPSKK